MNATSDTPRLIRHTAAVVALFALVTFTYLIADDAAYGTAFLFAAPIAFAVVALGRSVAVVLAGLALVFFVVVEDARPEGLAGADLLIAAGVRAAVFLGSAIVVDRVVRRQDRLARALAAREAEIAQLAALRSALTPPALSHPPSMQLADAFVPADGVAAGDFYFAVEQADGSVMIVLGDVVGHGLKAAERASFVRLILATLAKSVSDPVQLLTLGNTALVEQQGTSGDFATVLCVCVDPATRIVAWASAGHPQPLELDTGRPVAQHQPGPPLGVTADWSGTLEQIALDENGGLLLYTDGLTEARSHTHIAGSSTLLLGEDAVRRELVELAGRSPRDIVDHLNQAACRFVGGDLTDDLTALAFRVVAHGGDATFADDPEKSPHARL